MPQVSQLACNIQSMYVSLVSARAKRARFPGSEAEGRAVRLFHRSFCTEWFACGEPEVEKVRAVYSSRLLKPITNKGFQRSRRF